METVASSCQAVHLPTARHVSPVVTRLGVLPAVVLEVKAIQTAAVRVVAILTIHADLLVAASAVKESAVMIMATTRLVMSQTVQSETQEIMGMATRAVIRIVRPTVETKMTGRDVIIAVTRRTDRSSVVIRVLMTRLLPTIVIRATIAITDT